MFERFTDRARRVVQLAQEEARALGHSYIGTEHLLLGMMSEGEGVAAQALAALGVTLAAARTEVEAVAGRGEGMPPGEQVPFTPRAKKVLELALREALQLDHDYIGTEHILLGIVREGEGVAAQVLTRLGPGPQRVRAQVLETLQVTPRGERPGVVSAVRRRLSGEMGGVVRLDQLTGRLDAIERRLARIEEILGGRAGPAPAAQPAPGAPPAPEAPAPGAPGEPPAGDPPHRT